MWLVVAVTRPITIIITPTFCKFNADGYIIFCHWVFTAKTLQEYWFWISRPFRHKLGCTPRGSKQKEQTSTDKKFTRSPGLGWGRCGRWCCDSPGLYCSLHCFGLIVLHTSSITTVTETRPKSRGWRSDGECGVLQSGHQHLSVITARTEASSRGRAQDQIEGILIKSGSRMEARIQYSPSD